MNKTQINDSWGGGFPFIARLTEQLATNLVPKILTESRPGPSFQIWNNNNRIVDGFIIIIAMTKERDTVRQRLRERNSHNLQFTSPALVPVSRKVIGRERDSTTDVIILMLNKSRNVPSPPTRFYRATNITRSRPIQIYSILNTHIHISCRCTLAQSGGKWWGIGIKEKMLWRRASCSDGIFNGSENM